MKKRRTQNAERRTMEFAEVFAARRWTPIRNCPGRYALADGAVKEPPDAIVAGQAQEFESASARDAVVIVPFGAGGGLISYRRADGTFLHTLNDADGFDRKLRELQIVLRS